MAAALLLAVNAHAGPLQDANAAADRGDYATALSLLKPMADAGNVDALGNLGNLYAFGRGVERNLKTAHEYWQRAADKHLASAMFNIAVLHFNGHGDFPQNNELAASWYKRAAEHRHVQAMLTLSSIYATGRGMKPDRRQAIVWASLAESNAPTPNIRQMALGQLKTLLDGMTPEEMEKIQPLVSETAKLIDRNVAAYLANATR
jgi:uncharacterized protein